MRVTNGSDLLLGDITLHSGVLYILVIIRYMRPTGSGGFTGKLKNPKNSFAKDELDHFTLL